MFSPDTTTDVQTIDESTFASLSPGTRVFIRDGFFDVHRICSLGDQVAILKGVSQQKTLYCRIGTVEDLPLDNLDNPDTIRCIVVADESRGQGHYLYCTPRSGTGLSLTIQT